VSFLIYAIEGFRDGLKEQIQVVRAQQWDVSWQNYVYQKLKDGGEADIRRRQLVFDLGRQLNPVPKPKLAEISGRVALAYAKLDDKTLSRDLDALEEAKLIVKESGGYVANKTLILAFLPAVMVIGDRDSDATSKDRLPFGTAAAAESFPSIPKN